MTLFKAKYYYNPTVDGRLLSDYIYIHIKTQHNINIYFYYYNDEFTKINEAQFNLMENYDKIEFETFG